MSLPTAKSDQPLISPLTESHDTLRIVGIGGSAGGLEALTTLLHFFPKEPKTAFIVVMHHSPQGDIYLKNLIQKNTALETVEIVDGTHIEEEKIYIVPSRKRVALINRSIHLFDDDSTSSHGTIDQLFISLSEDQKERAICVLLSGAGSDGSVGVRKVRAQGGLVIAQDNHSALFKSMPQTAVQTGAVDVVLAPEEIGNYIVENLKYPPVKVTTSSLPNIPLEILEKIFVLLRARIGHDFSFYKKSTIRRRIERRMSIHQIQDVRQYLRFLQENSGEVELLFQEFLIGVTSFFRDTPAFDFLSATVLPNLLSSKADVSPLRIWTAACSTGEEAYSIAICLHECMMQLGRRVPVQIFATDLDKHAIDIARYGRYPHSISSQVSPERLERHFIKEGNVYRLRKGIREMVIFAPHDVLSDPPFTKLDLLSCRNFLIYLSPELQKRVIPIFHYALKPDGVLFLGSSETIGGFHDLFGTLERKWKFLYRKEAAYANRHVKEFPVRSKDTDSQLYRSVMRSPQKIKDLKFVEEVERFLLRTCVAPTALVNSEGEVLYIHGKTGQFLEPATGQATLNITEMAREGLQVELSSALRKAANEEKEVRYRNIKVKNNGGWIHIDLSVHKITDSGPLQGLYKVGFESIAVEQDIQPTDSAAASRLEHNNDLELIKELEYTKDHLQRTIEELETANEELKSANEELQSMNEELQSTNEELETAKEETQSLNEELQTVNSELQSKIDELSRAEEDSTNLLNSLDIAMLFLDNLLNIKRYTIQAKKLINLIPSDIGRPISDIVSQIDELSLAIVAREVLQTLSSQEQEIRAKDGTRYLMRSRLCRTIDNLIGGVVITFVDISQVKGREEVY